MNSNPLIGLACAAEDWLTCDMSADVTHDTRRAVLDWFGSMLPGCVQGPAVPLTRALQSERGEGISVVYAAGLNGTARHAALLNGTASHTAEFDDIFRDGGYHPGSPTISAALAVAQSEGSSLSAFHRAVIGGYEVGCRIAMALQPSHYLNWHITATVGTMGAAVSTAMLKGCDAEGISHAIAIASSFAGGHQENLQGHGQIKPMHCGHAADAGVLAGLAAAEGITGSLDSLNAAHGYASATSENTGDWVKGLAGLGDWTPISRMTFKNHGCCGHIFPTLDGLRAAQAEHLFEPEDVARITVYGYGPTKSICDRMDVTSAQDARFSLQYCVAALLYTGGVRLAAFTPESLARSDFREFMNKIIINEDTEISAKYPEQRQARLMIKLASGKQIEHFQLTRKGDPDCPLTDSELFQKFDELTHNVVSAEQAARLKYQVMTSDELPGAVVLTCHNGSKRPQNPIKDT